MGWDGNGNRDGDVMETGMGWNGDGDRDRNGDKDGMGMKMELGTGSPQGRGRVVLAELVADVAAHEEEGEGC